LASLIWGNDCVIFLGMGKNDVYLAWMGLGAIVFLAGSISFVTRLKAVKSLVLATQWNYGYLFLIAGLAVVLIAALFLVSDKEQEPKE